MHIMQSRRDFLAGLSAAGAAGVLARGHRSPTGAARNRHDPDRQDSRHLLRAPVHRRRTAARRRIHRHQLRAHGWRLDGPADGRTRRDRLRLHFRGNIVHNLDAGVPVTVLAGVHSGCYELFTHGPIQTIGDLKGRRVGIQSLSSSAHLYMAIMAAQVGLDPHEDIEWVVPSRRQGHGAVRRAESRCLPRLSARAAGAARPQDRTDDPQHDHGQAMVALFLLQLFGNRDFIHASSGRHQTLPARDPQGCRPLRHRAGAGRASD